MFLEDKLILSSSEIPQKNHKDIFVRPPDGKFKPTIDGVYWQCGFDRDGAVLLRDQVGKLKFISIKYYHWTLHVVAELTTPWLYACVNIHFCVTLHKSINCGKFWLYTVVCWWIGHITHKFFTSLAWCITMDWQLSISRIGVESDCLMMHHLLNSEEVVDLVVCSQKKTSSLRMYSMIAFAYLSRNNYG